MKGATYNENQAVAMSDLRQEGSHQVSNQIQNHNVPELQIVNEEPQPSNYTTFPLSYKRAPVLIISILKCVIGFIQITVGIANIFVVPYFTSWIAFPVWCGILFLVNGVIGSCTYRSQSRCMIGTFLALSITSLIFSIIMLACYSVTLDYFVGIQKTQSLFKSGGFSISITPDTDVSVGLTGFLVFLIIFELCLSSAAIVYSCKAYSKCCNTFDANDCYTCIGCGCETCDGCCGDIPHAKLEDQAYARYSVNSGSNQVSNPNQNESVPGIQIVNQHPPLSRDSTFPLSYKRGSVLIISILKCVIGFLQIAVGIANIFVVPYFTSLVAFPVWCGVLFLVNGIIGSCTYRSQSRCMIGTFLALNITSLIFSVTMLACYSVTFEYFVGILKLYLKLKISGLSYSYLNVQHSTMEDSIGLTGFLLFLIVFEICLSTAALVYSCKAYSKCCNTCDDDDCCIFIGCCCEACDGCCEQNPYQRYEDRAYTHNSTGNSQFSQQYVVNSNGQLQSPGTQLVMLPNGMQMQQVPQSAMNMATGSYHQPQGMFPVQTMSLQNQQTGPSYATVASHSQQSNTCNMSPRPWQSQNQAQCCYAVGCHLLHPVPLAQAMPVETPQPGAASSTVISQATNNAFNGAAGSLLAPNQACACSGVHFHPSNTVSLAQAMPAQTPQAGPYSSTVTSQGPNSAPIGSSPQNTSTNLPPVAQDINIQSSQAGQNISTVQSVKNGDQNPPNGEMVQTSHANTQAAADQGV